MELTHTFTVPLGIDDAFAVLTDIERIAPCMPGATIESVDGRAFTGKVKVKVGPMQITYSGKAEYEQIDVDTHTVVIAARGQETRGSGTANATVTAALAEQDDQTEVTVVSNLQVTGRPAQFGRGVMNDVGAKLLGQFADCVSERLAGPEARADEAEADDDDTIELTTTGPSVATNGSSAAASEQQITEVAGTAPPQPPSGAQLAAATAAPPADPPAEAPQASSSADTSRPSEAARSATDARSSQPTGSRPPRQTFTPPQNDVIDLFDVAGPPIAKRLAPLAIALLVVVLLWRRRSR